MDKQIEEWAAAEFREGVSAGAAARQLCRLLGAHAVAPTLHRMLEEMLADANLSAFDRAMILMDFAEASPDAARDAKLDSFRRINRSEERVLS